MADTHRTKQSDTKTRILDAAEKLFAQNGFKNTSISLLARKARVNQAAVNYHFGSKGALVEQVISRRISPIDRQRMANLQRIKETANRQGYPPAIEDLLRAFIDPAFILTEGAPGEKWFLVIAGRAFSEPDETIRNVFIRHFEPAFLLFAALMKKALPGLPEAVLRWRLHFVLGALSHAMRLCGSHRLTAASAPPPDTTETVVNRLVAFLTTGMDAPDDSANE
jgi:AcrR family transcriptional regulator